MLDSFTEFLAPFTDNQIGFTDIEFLLDGMSITFILKLKR